MRRVRLAAALATLLLLSGCATIPEGGPVETAPPSKQQDDSGFFFTPNKPADGASPENIVRGFIQAASAGRGYGIAKEFLTDGFAKQWRPDAGVTVHVTPWTTTAQSGGRVLLTVPASAEVNGAGVYTPTTQPVTLPFQLQQQRGQWRIAKCPNGVVLAQPAFLHVYKSALLQFFDADYQRFVPDRRWFPVQQDDEVPDTVRALIAGQAPPLVQVTRTAFPSSAQLARPVRMSGGQVLVDLSTPGAQPDEQATNRMQQQIAASLSPLATSAVRLTVNGRTAPVAPQADLQQQSATDPAVISGDRFGTLTASGSVQQDRELGPQIVALQPTEVTVSAQRRIAAVLAGNGHVEVVSTRGRPRTVDSRGDLAAPTLDQAGWTYSVPHDDPSGLRATSPSGVSVDLPGDLGGSSVTTIEVSPDGTRMLVVVGSTGGSEAYVKGILRDAKGRPVGLTSASYVVDTGDAGVLDATWVDQSSVALLSEGASVQTVSVQLLGGLTTSLGPPLLGAREIVGVTSKDDLRVLLGTGELVRRVTSGWTIEVPASIGVDVLAVQR